ncbi:MAG: excinuclease ABC subunit UvrB [Candidatus Ancillula sp.]|jgi:excinuclease ABC subunit B|nr:excinuclease ABC subunit UvrB [Candidatus Ancillula sp.]
MKFERQNNRMEVITEYTPSGDQPAAITELAKRINAGETDVVVLGATGTGKSATTAWLIEQVQRPTLIIEPNKTLAAQLTQEFRELMPNNAVGYFVSYYDYYQPESYIPQTDTFIEKDSSVNDDIDRLRHLATSSLMSRNDVVIVSTVSCIYGLGEPEEYLAQMLTLKMGDEMSQREMLTRFTDMQYDRNDIDFKRGTFRVKGDTIEIIPAYEQESVRIEMFGDEIESLSMFNPLTGDKIRDVEIVHIFPATHFVSNEENRKRAVADIRKELTERVEWFKSRGKLVEAQRLEMRTTYDLEMIEEIGFCKGIENYSRHFDNRPAGSAPSTLLDFFPDNFLLVLDESHVTVPQIGAMSAGDASRKRMLVDYGFRLPSAADNRPLTWQEFLARVHQTVYLSATPGNYEMEQQKLQTDKSPVELIIRPTGLVDPEIEVRPIKGQIDDLLSEVRKRAENHERVLITTLTKRLAEELTNYMLERNIKVEYMHSDVDTLRRIELLRDLRKGKIDCIVGINLLREGLDLPEVSLVAILDADKQGFLRSERSLIQTIGRAARNVDGKVIMYADKTTPQMRNAIDETNRRRKKQVQYNLEHGIDPTPLVKKIADVTDQLWEDEIESVRNELPESDLSSLVEQLNEQMRAAAGELNFELAARLRDEILDLKKELRQMVSATK